MRVEFRLRRRRFTICSLTTTKEDHDATNVGSKAGNTGSISILLHATTRIDASQLGHHRRHKDRNLLGTSSDTRHLWRGRGCCLCDLNAGGWCPVNCEPGSRWAIVCSAHSKHCTCMGVGEDAITNFLAPLHSTRPRPAHAFLRTRRV